VTAPASVLRMVTSRIMGPAWPDGVLDH